MVFSFAVSLAASFWFFSVPRSLFLIVALLVVLYVLFGPFSLPAFLLVFGWKYFTAGNLLKKEG
jgi:hypothetical protein